MIVSGICVLPIFASEAKDPFVLIPKAKTESYGQDVDKLTNPNTPEGKKFWNAYNTTAKKYLEKDES